MIKKHCLPHINKQNIPKVNFSGNTTPAILKAATYITQ